MAFDRVGVISNLDVDTAEDVAVIDCSGFKALWAEFVVGVANLSAFTVEARVRPGGDWMPLASASGDYTTPVHPIVRASGNLAAAAFGSTVHFVKINVEGLHSIRLRAAGTSSSIVGGWSLG